MEKEETLDDVAIEKLLGPPAHRAAAAESNGEATSLVTPAGERVKQGDNDRAARPRPLRWPKNPFRPWNTLDPARSPS